MHVRVLLALGVFLIADCAWRIANSKGAPATDPNSRPASHNRSEFSGWVAAEGRLFFNDPLFPGQEENNGSLAGQPEYYHRWENGSAFTFTPFGRVDSADPERTHWDIRELNYLYPGDSWFFRFGVARVFWGATEFVHLVDIVNQTDWVEHIDGEEKLGQPMIEFSLTKGWGTMDFFVLPYFRERTFPGREGRLRHGLIIDADRAFYESTAGEHSVDLALRYSRSFGSIDFGIYYFKGTNRDPLLVPAQMLDPNATGEPTLIPFYDKIDQVGTDVQWAMGNWLWKLEALYRDGLFQNYFAATGGLEYTLSNVGQTGTDLGLVFEYAYDQRRERATTPYKNDAMAGLRVSPKDAASTQILMGYIQDMDDSSKAAILEATRRLGDHWKLSLDVWTFMDLAPGNLYYDLRHDSFARLELAYYF